MNLALAASGSSAALPDAWSSALSVTVVLQLGLLPHLRGETSQCPNPRLAWGFLLRVPSASITASFPASPGCPHGRQDLGHFRTVEQWHAALF